jgi:hypothetical protein
LKLTKPSIMELRSLTPVLGRHEGEERKGRTGHTADNEAGVRGLTAPAATARGAKFLIGATGLPRGYWPPDATRASHAGYHIAGEGLWNASLFSEASGPRFSKRRRQRDRCAAS